MNIVDDIKEFADAHYNLGYLDGLLVGIGKENDLSVAISEYITKLFLAKREQFITTTPNIIPRPSPTVVPNTPDPYKPDPYKKVTCSTAERREDE